MPHREQAEKLDIDEKMVEVINQCLDKNLSNPVEIMKYLLRQLVQERALNVSDVSNIEGYLGQNSGGSQFSRRSQTSRRKSRISCRKANQP